MLGDSTSLQHTKLYFMEGVTTTLCPYTLKAPDKQSNNLKVEHNIITPMETFVGTTTYINWKRQRVWYCTLHLLDTQLQKSNMYRLPKWDPSTHAGIYLGQSLYLLMQAWYPWISIFLLCLYHISTMLCLMITFWLSLLCGNIQFLLIGKT